MLYLKSHQEKYIVYLFLYPVYLKFRGQVPKLRKQKYITIRLNTYKVCNDFNNNKKLLGIHHGLCVHVALVLSLFMLAVGYRIVPSINEEFVKSYKEQRHLKECNEQPRDCGQDLSSKLSSNGPGGIIWITPGSSETLPSFKYNTPSLARHSGRSLLTSPRQLKYVGLPSCYLLSYLYICCYNALCCVLQQLTFQRVKYGILLVSLLQLL